MNIFNKKLRQAQEPNLPIDPIKLYETCPYAEGYAYLRGIQEEVLKTWHQNRAQRDVLCKMNTGSGKTMTGLLMLYSKLIENKEPCMYACPDKQLVEQTVKLAAFYGIPVCEFVEQGVFPTDFINGKKILICTFQKLFNGKSIFKRNNIKLGAIILDDAHKCVDIAREQSSIKLPRAHSIAEKLIRLFENDLKHQSSGSFYRLKDEDPTVMMKVPYWAWMDNQDKIIQIINDYISESLKDTNEDKSIVFNWNFIVDNVLTYDCYIGGQTIEITPIHVPYYEIPSFNEATHRYILSATFEDDYDLIKDLGIEFKSIMKPIIPDDRKDIGKRLILAPSRYDTALTEDVLQKFIATYPKAGYNVVVLVPSGAKAEKWTKTGAELVDKSNIEAALTKLKGGTGHFMVFSNRYDGIDLHSDLCRILVIDGLPGYGSLQEQYVEARLDSLRAGKKAQIIDQGLGRGVRSGGDYCVVYLMGHDLVTFLGYEKHIKHFTPVTRAQLDLGLQLLDDESTTDSLKLIKETASYCLSQDPGWTRYHSTELAKVAMDKVDERKERLLRFAEYEKQALTEFRKRRYDDASEIILTNIVNKEPISNREKAWYYQFSAQLLYLGNTVLANDLQSKAWDFTTQMFHPADGQLYKKILRKETGKQAAVVKQNISEFARPQDIIVHVNGILKDLQYIPEIKAERFETQLAELGRFLGFAAQMPEIELGNGPDVLWVLTDGHYLILEAKSRAIHDIISRENIGQLLQSEEWFKKTYGNASEYTAVTLQNSNRKGRNVTISDNTKVIDKESLDDLRENLKRFSQALQAVHPKTHTEKEIAKLLESHKFTAALFRTTYLKNIKN